MTSGTEAAKSASKRESRARERAQAAQVEKVLTAFAERHIQRTEAEAARRVKEVEAETIERLKAIDAQIARRKQTEAAARGDTASEAADEEAPPEAAVAKSPAGPEATPADDENPAAGAGPSRSEAARSADAQEAPPEVPGAPLETGVSPAGAPQPGDASPAAGLSADARLDQRVQDLEAALRGADTDAGASLAEAIAALTLEVANNVDEEVARASAEATSDRAEPGTSADRLDAVDDAPASRSGDAWWTVKGFSVWSLAFWAALFAALQLAQWVVIALSRDYHDAISRKASLLTGLEPEEEDITPRVRVNFPWMRKKLKRRWRAFLLLMVGVPALFVVTLPFVCFSHAVFTLLFTAWSAWWAMVFTAAKSSRAWEPSAGPTRPPWFLRAWTTLTTRVPGLRWGVLQRYGASWGRRTEEVLAPVASTERHPWVFAGLAVVRFMGSFPPMKFFIRPLIPVASAHLLEEDVAAARKALAAGADASPPSAQVPRPADVW
ncbi:hypothetical protein [Myxococcus sp. Y35]|uniref:hypothetical protein n=1 Tax=Pseudomyxococcus flavus TaxID=3115648 RepID=UPI003CED6E97